MKLRIIDDQCEEKIIENPTFIPRLGDRVTWFYFPNPKVKDVIFDYENGEVIVILE